MKCSNRAKHVMALTVLAGMAAYVIWHFAGRPNLGEVSDNFSDIWADLWNEGPELSDNTTHYWRTGGRGGLTLHMVNQLDSSWQTEFESAVREWENGDPDVLTLTTERGSPASSCAMELGVMKVCNDNYGDTGWLGINEIVLSGLDGDTIEASMAKMNDYYLDRADQYERLYTVCHELGHGFGLPHTDENFNNRDLGNCMDYTNRPRNNLLPGRANFLRLAEMYGIPNVQPRSSGGGNRNLRGSEYGFAVEGKPFPVELMGVYNRAMAELHHNLRLKLQDEQAERRAGWRLLQEHSKGGEYMRRLDSEYSIKVQVLYGKRSNEAITKTTSEVVSAMEAANDPTIYRTPFDNALISQYFPILNRNKR